MRSLACLLTLSLLVPASAQAAPVRVEFWHAMTGVKDTEIGRAHV